MLPEPGLTGTITSQPDGPITSEAPSNRSVSENMPLAIRNNDSSTDADVEALIKRIESLQVDITDGYDRWLRILFALANQFGEAGRDYAHRVSYFNPGYNYAVCNRQFDSCLRSGKSGITIRTLFHFASEEGIRLNNSAEVSAHFNELSIDLPCSIPSDIPNFTQVEAEIPQPAISLQNSEIPYYSTNVINSAKSAIRQPQSAILPFPVDIFPPQIYAFIHAASNSINCPPDFLAVPVIAVLATAIGNSRNILLKRGWIEGPRIYSAIVAPPGSKKSPALAAALQPIRKLQDAYCAEYDAAYKDYEFASSAYNIQLEIWKKRKPEEKSPEEQPREPIEPVLKQIKTSNATIEAIGKLLDQNKRGIMFDQDELAAWVKSMNAYRGGKGSDLEYWLSIWNGSQSIINRASTAKPLIINRPLVNVVGCIQPDLLSDLSGIKQNGFFDRILTSFPDSIPQHYTTDELPDEIAFAYNDLVKAIFELQPGFDPEGNEEPFLMNLTDAARIEWEQWNRMHDDEMNSPDLSYHLRGVWSKLQAYMARFMLILQLTHDAANGLHSFEIHPRSVTDAARLIVYFKSHIRKVYKALFNSEMDRRIELAVEWIERKGGKVSQRMLQANNVANCRTAQEVSELFTELEERGVGTMSRSTPAGGGRPSLNFMLTHPTIDQKAL